MVLGKLTLPALIVGASFAPVAVAASTIASYSFDATLTSGAVVCGAFGISEASCPERFGTISGNKANDFMFGKSIGSTYSGEIHVEFGEGRIVKASCEIGGADCAISDDMLEPPIGSPEIINFSDFIDVLAVFRFEEDTGNMAFGTGFEFFGEDVQYYSKVNFDLTNVKRGDVEVVPLMGSAGFLGLALGGFVALSRRKSRKAT